MKKYRGLAALVGLVLLMACACAAAAEEQLPGGILDYFSAETYAGAEITGSAHWEETGSGDTWFVLLRAKDETNILYCFTRKNGAWARSFATRKAVPQGRNRVTVSTTDVLEDYTTGRMYYGPMLIIAQEDEGDEYTELFTAYQRSEDGQWMLFRIWSHTDYGNMVLGDGTITYYKDLETPAEEGTVRGTFQRDLRYVSLSAVPKSFRQARQKLTVAPELPEGSELTATETEFTGGKKYAVYSAPDAQSLRGGNGKAAVSTNGWIQVFGKENGWILIQYSIDSGHYRFGYIDAASLPKEAVVKNLDFSGTEAAADYPVNVTDDPLYSQSTLAVLGAGETVTWLATMGDWAYIEGRGFRGFIPADALSSRKSVQDSVKAGYEVYTGRDGEQYDLFEVRKLHYDENHRVYAVSGVYERVAQDDDCYYGKTAEDGTFTYRLSADFRAEMMNPETGDPMEPNVPVPDLYAWYIDAYLCGEAPESGDLVFLYDLPADQQETAEADFWFVTTRIRLNTQKEIEHMEYYYVPWG